MMATEDEARQALIDNIAKYAPDANVNSVLKYAEALAWLTSPAEAHGNSAGT